MKQELKVLGVFLMWGLMLVMAMTFYTAFFNPSKTVLVMIDEYGEANLEAVLFIVLLIIGSFTVYREVLEYNTYVKEKYTSRRGNSRFKTLSCIFFAVCIVLVTPIMVNSLECYQESSNKTDQTGLDGNCNLTYNGTYSPVDWVGAFDGSWDTSKSPTSTQIFIINYSKPDNLIGLDKVVWRVKSVIFGKPPILLNLTLDDSCVNDLSNISLKFVKDPEGGYPAFTRHDFSCFDGSSYVLLNRTRYFEAGGANNFYEEAIVWDYRFNENSQTFNSTTTEGNIETFKINITYNSSFYTNTEIKLIYNGTEHLSSTTDTGDTRIYSVPLIIPSVETTTNNTFYWNVRLNNGTWYDSNTTTINQTVNDIQVDDCSSFSNVLLNMSLKDEITQNLLNADKYNTTVQVDLQVFTIGVSIPFINFSQNYSENNNPKICLEETLGGSEYRMDVQIFYDGDDYSAEYYHIQNFTLTNDTLEQNITLYDLQDDKAQVFKVSFKDSSFLAVPDALIQIQRKYINEGIFKTVEISKTDSQGETVAHLQLNDAVYTIIVVKEGVVLATFDNVRAECQNPALQTCEINLNSFATSISPQDYTVGDDISFTLTYDKTTRVIQSVYTIPSGTSSTVILNATLFDNIGQTQVCSHTLTSASGTLSCIVPTSFGNGTVIAKVTKDGEVVGEAWIKLESSPDDIYGASIVFLGLFLLLTIIGLGINENPMVTGIFIIVAAGLLGAMNVIVTNKYIGGGATLLWLIIAVVIVMIKGAKRS